MDENPNLARQDLISRHARAAGTFVDPNSGNRVWLPLFMAFGIKVVADWKLTPGKTPHHATYKAEGVIQSLLEQNYGAWIVVFGVLFLMADIETTSQLAVALAWLIFIGIALSKGEDALRHTGVFPKAENTSFKRFMKKDS